MSKIVDEEMRRMMEAYSGKKRKDIKELTPELKAKRKAEWEEFLKLTREEQQERLRLKNKDQD